MNTDILGIIAGICTTGSFIPQMIKILKTKHTKDISLIMYVVFTVGIVLWLVYGVLIMEIPVIVANVTALIFCSVILAAKIRYG